MFKKNKSLKDILIIHEVAFICLILLAVTTGGIGISLWQTLNQETQRISSLVSEVQQTRGDLYRQIKELFDAFFLADEGAREEYDQFTVAVETHFVTLNSMAMGAAEKSAIDDLHENYLSFVRETTRLFVQKNALSNERNREKMQHALNKGIEEGLFNRFEFILARTEKLLANQQTALDQRLETIQRTSITLLCIPILLAILLLFFSRYFLKSQIVKPINEVLKATSAMSTGDLSVKASEEGVAELVAVSQSINKMAEQLAIIQQTLIQTEKQAAQGSLVPMLAHNIRNPLASIRATAQILDTPEADQDTRESITGIIDTVDRLERWTGALLAYLHPLKPQLAKANLIHIITGACSPLQQKVKERQVTLKIPDAQSIEIMTDKHLLEQVIYNFILNAIDASPRASTIEIKVSEISEHYHLQIIDNGCGMPFTPDASATNAPTTKRFGTGLGIPFGFKVCEALNSRLTFSTRQTGGTCINITLPKS